MATFLYEVVDFVRVHLADIVKPYKHEDDTILLALRVTTSFLALLGYEKSHTSDFNEITPTLSEKEKGLWGKAAAVLLRNPKALQLAAESISIRTEEVSYSTTVGAGLVKEITASDLNELRRMILQLSDALVARRPDFGLQLGKDSDYSGLDPVND